MDTLKQVHTASTANALNVIFVHGLGGDARLTWMHNPKDHTTLWPTWIGEDADCNVWIAGYGAAISGWTEAAMHLRDQGEALFAALQAEPRLRQGQLVMIGHSLGGLVIKSGMTQAQTLGDTRREAVLARIAAVVFIGTPHQGSSLATLASGISTPLRINPQVVNMASDDAWLKLLNDQFRNLQAQQQFRVRVFFETKGILLGRKIWLFQLGKRVTIVDRNSSDPGIAQVIPTGLEGNHFEIAKPTSRDHLGHKLLLEFLAGLGETTPPSGLDSDAHNERNDLIENLEVTQRLQKASGALLSWPSALPDGTWLERTELDTLNERITTSSATVQYLLGEPGCGKSSLLVRLAQDKQAAGWAVLAIKADRLPAEVRDRDALDRYLALGGDSIAVLRSLRQTTSVLVVIDQLDALADLVVQQSARLRVLLDFVQDLSNVPNMHVVISCRTFEQKHDPALRNLNATLLTLELPSWDAVSPILEAKGLQASVWSEELQQVLRSPHALDIFLSLLDGTTEPAALKSFQGLLEQQWRSQVLCDTTNKRRATLRHLAKLMAEREVLGLPLAIVEEHYSEIRALEAAGLLRVDRSPGRVEFRHQTLYEFVRARSFLEESGSLTEAVRTQQSSLRIRPQLWHALGYFRGASPEEYGTEIGALWAADLRPHLKMLLIEFWGRQTSPLRAEHQIVEEALNDPWFVPRFLGAASGSPGWFAVLSRVHLPKLMSLEGDKSAIVLPVLREALHFDTNTVLSLIGRYWLPNSDRDILSWQLLSTADSPPQLGPWLDSLVLIAGRTRISEVAIGHMTSVVSVDHPDEAPKIVAAWLQREIDAAISNVEADAGTFEDEDEDEDEDDNGGSEASFGTVSKRVQSVLESRQFYDLEAIAESAPKAFVQTLWPVLVEALSLCSSNASSSRNQYRQNTGAMFDELDGEESRYDRPMLRAIQLAVQAWAGLDSEGFLAFAEAQADSDLLLVHRLMAVGRLKTVNVRPLLAFNYLIADSRRLSLGPYTDLHKESLALIAGVSPHLDQANFALLEATIQNWTYYGDTEQLDEDASNRQQTLQWNRQHRLRLLRALPEAQRSPALQRFIDEEERAFPGLQSRDIHFSGAMFIGSPVSAEQMAKADDSDVLNLFNELTDESAWGHPRHLMKGGAIQAGRELAEMAKRDLDKTLRIVRGLDPISNEIPVSTVLGELVPAGLASHELYSLIIELEEKGFESAGFRRNAAYAIARASSKDSPVPDALTGRMELWLTRLPSEMAEDSDSFKNRDNSSVLWGRGSLHVLPGGNYPILAALTVACVNTYPVMYERWLSVLEKHAEGNESSRVWGALLQRELLQLQSVESSRAESLIDKIVKSVPNVVDEPGWTYFVARAIHWASADAVQRWIMSTAESTHGAQGAGELVILRHALFPEEKWSREMAYSLLHGATQLSLGLAHGVAHLWNESKTRPVVHPFLLALLRSKDDQILAALSVVMMRDQLDADFETQELLDAVIAYPGILRNGRAERLPEMLAKLVAAEPKRVCEVANALLNTAGDQMGNIATAWYLSTEWLLDIALQLQDMGPAEREDGSLLFERMLEFNMPQAKEMTLDLDKRTPASGGQRAPVRRRSRRGRSKPMPSAE
jgi:pimeloyl-ACP methyl ester carboxylesterase